MKDKREFARLDLNVKVDWKKISETPEPKQEFSDKTKNISAGGLCLVVYEKLCWRKNANRNGVTLKESHKS